MPPERLVEGLDAGAPVRIPGGLDLGIEIGMRPKRALRKGDERARQNVRAFHRDGDRRRRVAGEEVVRWAVLHPRPPWISMASLTRSRIASVVRYLSSAEMTAGFCPSSTIEAVSAAPPRRYRTT